MSFRTITLLSSQGSELTMTTARGSKFIIPLKGKKALQTHPFAWPRYKMCLEVNKPFFWLRLESFSEENLRTLFLLKLLHQKLHNVSPDSCRNISAFCSSRI
ncbi:hypothetical protein CEXT_55771 [Caerostris extrusa]|uniref:Uncharacterized protein n=1 Tax=Caerostris extrusa TaxID=172846 RepID=A0AAV4QLW1_CAEEX|nr:hypothetical protein CEXT_55771 [Caerostris extrusa]